MSDVSLSIRIDLPGGRFGPGKAALLQAIADHGSISAAARTLGMSYARAWSLTEQMNACFGHRLVETFAGGSRRGGARLTDTGNRVLALYRRVADEAGRSASGALDEMCSLSR